MTGVFQTVRTVIIVVGICLFVCACSSKTSSVHQQIASSPLPIMTSSTYEQATDSPAPAITSTAPLDNSSSTQAPLTFHGFTCTEDCSGHEAGYNWAEEHDIDDPHTCYSGPRLSDPDNESFSEGCEAYVDDSTGAAPLDAGERYSGSSSDDSDTNN